MFEGEREHLGVLAVGESQLVMVMGGPPDVFEGFVGTAQAVLDSIAFEEDL